MCQHPQCGGELYDLAYRVTRTSQFVSAPKYRGQLVLHQTHGVYCPECTPEYLHDALTAAKHFQLDDLPSVEPMKPCSDCGRFTCWCES